MLKVPAYHILDFFCFRRKDAGVCIRNMSRRSVTCLCRDSEVLGAHEVWDWAALRDFSGHRPESKGPRSYSAPSPCSRAPKLHPCLRSCGEKCRICQQQSSQTFCLCHQSKWEKGERIILGEMQKPSTWSWITGPKWPCLSKGVGPGDLQRSLPTSTPNKGSSHCAVKRDLSLSSACYRSEQGTGPSGRTCCSSTTKHFLDLSLKAFDCLSIQTTLLGLFLPPPSSDFKLPACVLQVSLSGCNHLQI